MTNNLVSPRPGARQKADASSNALLVIEPRHGWLPLELGELWRYRDLLALLVWRDFSSRYRQTLLGVSWAAIRPILTVLVFTVIFGRVARLPSDGVPYVLFTFTAMLPWLCFSNAIISATTSIVGASALVTKVYFPRVILPLATVASSLIDFGIQLFLVLGLAAWYGVRPTTALLLVPIFVIQCILASAACSVWLTALNVRYRDVGHVVPFLTQIGMYLSPIVYSTSMVPPRWRPIYSLNPMVGVIDGFRWSLLGQTVADLKLLAISALSMTILLVTGLYYFRRVEDDFADIV